MEHRAASLAEQLGLPLLSAQDDPAAFSLALDYAEDGLGIRPLDGSVGRVRVDFLSGANRHRLRFGGGRGQQLAKAVGLDRKNFTPHIVDLTAGLGRDAFVLAALGARLSLVERHPVVYALLADGLARAAADETVAAIIARLSCHYGEGEAFLRQLQEKPDVIYLDPMFPPRSKSAKVKKEMQLFHQLVGCDDDTAALLAPALAAVRYRVVVKRPLHAPVLAGVEPSLRLKGKSTRFDIYAVAKIPVG